MSSSRVGAAPMSARGFHVMAKPIGPLCNLDCRYCFYLEKESLFPGKHSFEMSDDVLEKYIRRYIQSQRTAEITFAWQGGEPTLLGLSFFRKVVALQRLFAGGRSVRNSFQTNGVLLDDAWCEFFAKEQFLVGLSLDGPEEVHDWYRRDKGGRGSFSRVFAALECLKKWGVSFNTLSCVTRESPEHAVAIYDFLKRQGVEYMQFIPIVEPLENGVASAESVTAEGYGVFLSRIFDEWIKQDVGRVFVNLFDIAFGAWCGVEPSLCVFAKKCGTAVAMEHNGDVYACDHFVDPAYFRGNIQDKSFEEMVYSVEQQAFGNLKSSGLPALCRGCEFLFACNGGCPKQRFCETQDGEAGLNYLCEGYKTFFKHVGPKFKEMASFVQKGRPASDIMKDGLSESQVKKHDVGTGRNDRCSCGSRKKFKKCCGK